MFQGAWRDCKQAKAVDNETGEITFITPTKKKK